MELPYNYFKEEVSFEHSVYQAQEILRSEEDYALSVRRMIELESMFGQLKNNRSFRRFLLRGMCSKKIN
ncbi:transposase [Paenibacillus sp. FSL R5-0470]|uniref:transposase n=1 Tax=Paenibacillus sp. FSL R5-0470 TaxID=2921641 RepID=UPI0030D73B2C